jgi:hypothetical protein
VVISANELASINPVLLSIAATCWAYLNSNFAAALFGALAGALSAHTIATRAEKRKSIKEEIAGVNSAVVLANSITNTFIAVKRQHVVMMAAFYKRQFDEYVQLVLHPPAQPTEYAFITDFRSLTPPLTSIVELRRTLDERVSSFGKAISVSVTLHQSIQSLGQVLVARERNFEKLRLLPTQDRLCAYFGLLNGAGNLDEAYPNLMTAIVEYVDDGIYFPMLLCELLEIHGRSLAKRYGRNSPVINSIKYGPEESGLLPDRTKYPDFERDFRPRTSMPHLGSFARFKSWYNARQMAN